jgi:ElaB/YqjD/DUF883 family membrane-anchored ribosome-binding protein
MNTTTDYQNNLAKEPSDMEQDINHTRERIGRTVEELEQRLSPGQLMDQALGYAREHGGDFASSVAGSVRRNPLPMIVTGIGILWLLKSQSSKASSSGRGSRIYSPYDDTADMYGNGGTAGDGSSLYRGSESDRDSGLYRGVDSGYERDSGGGIKDKLAGVGETIKSKVADMRSSASSTGGAVSEKLRSTTDSLSHRAQGLVGSAQSATRSLRQRTSSGTQGGVEQFRRAKGEFTTLMEEQPLLLGAIGVAIGATIAALVPTTRRERELMGSASDELAERASQLASQKYEELRETASHTVDEFTRSLKEGKSSDESDGQQSKSRQGTGGTSGAAGTGSTGSTSQSGSSTGSSSTGAYSTGASSTGASSTGASSTGSTSGGSVSGSGLSGSGASASRQTGPGSAAGSFSGGSTGSTSPGSSGASKPGSTSTRSS